MRKETDLGLDLREDESGEDGALEDQEDASLHRLTAVGEVDKHHTGQQRDADVVEKPGESVIWAPPKRKVGTFHDLDDLETERGGILLLVNLRKVSNFRNALGFELLDMLLNLDQLFGFCPNIAPILIPKAGLLAGADNVEHPFCGVRVGGTDGALLCKVLAEDLGVVADVAKVDTPSAALEEEQTVEVFKERRVRLVDCAEDCLSRGGELAEEADNVEGGLGVEAGGGFVEEEEEFGFSCQFNANCGRLVWEMRRRRYWGRTRNSLLFFNCEAVGVSDHGVRDIFHLQKPNDLFNIRILLFL